MCKSFPPRSNVTTPIQEQLQTPSVVVYFPPDQVAILNYIILSFILLLLLSLFWFHGFILWRNYSNDAHTSFDPSANIQTSHGNKEQAVIHTTVATTKSPQHRPLLTQHSSEDVEIDAVPFKKVTPLGSFPRTTSK